MGYLIESFLQKIEVEISAGNVAVLDSIPQQVIKSNELTDYTIVAANLSMKDQIGTISNFGHFYLQISYAIPGDRIAVFDENVGNISTDKKNNFLINTSHPPNRFGSVSSYTQDITVITELPPTATGDLIVTIYYFKNF